MPRNAHRLQCNQLKMTDEDSESESGEVTHGLVSIAVFQLANGTCLKQPRMSHTQTVHMYAVHIHAEKICLWATDNEKGMNFDERPPKMQLTLVPHSAVVMIERKIIGH